MSGAVFSEDRTFRYTLYRELAFPGSHERTVNFIGLNPSTADETLNDPTIRRCLGFARDWGYARLVMTNLYAYRATDPMALRTLLGRSPVGPENDYHLLREANAATLIVAAWSGFAPDRASAVRYLLRELDLHCLGLTKAGHPRHPLYMPASTRAVMLP